MKSLTDDEVAGRAQRWALLHKKPENRTKMDDVLSGITAEDKRRVYLCGQRMAAGLPLKVIPATTPTEEKTDAKKNDNRQPRPAKSGARGDKKQVSVGTDSESEKSDSRRPRAVHPKQ
jgi:hypothetical protein